MTWWQVKRSPRGKVHLVRVTSRARTACGFNVLTWMALEPVLMPWQGEDKCHVCLKVLASEKA